MTFLQLSFHDKTNRSNLFFGRKAYAPEIRIRILAVRSEFGRGFVQFYDLQSVFFPVTCIPVHRQSSTAISPVIPYLYSTMDSSKQDQVKHRSDIHIYIYTENKSQCHRCGFFNFRISLRGVWLLAVDRYALLRILHFRRLFSYVFVFPRGKWVYPIMHDDLNLTVHVVLGNSKKYEDRGNVTQS